jgi:CubicO group peptidase (beta-lactamase class C family)
MLRRLFMTMVALAAVTPARAQDMTSEIDKIFSWATPDGPGCAVAVAQNGKLVASRTYGSADLERAVPISPDTVFDAGSLRKQFVAAAVLLLVEDGRLGLSDDVRKSIPELPDYGHKITIDHLLTHTSGVRDWVGLRKLAGADEDALTLVLRQRGLNFAPGDEWAYSNSGYLLLTEVVARASGMAFSQFAGQRLFEPLGMKTTIYIDDLRTIVKNRALAYEKDGGRWKMAMLLDNERGGGALLSTANDLLTWNDALTSGRLGAFVTEKLQEPATLNNGRKLSYARGLFLDTYRDAKVVWHTGSADGYKSLLSRFPEQGVSIAIMCNSGDDTDKMAYGRRIYDLLVPAKDGKPAEPEALRAAAEGVDAASLDLKNKLGLFVSESTGDLLRLGLDDSMLRIAGGPPLMAVAKDRFRRPRPNVQFMSQDDFELSFLSPDEFELKSMEGKSTRYRRAEPYAPTADDLRAFAGRYENDEVRSVVQMAPGKGGLLGTLNDSREGVELRPITRDTFQLGRMMVRFVRDEAGRIVALDLSNPVLRNMRYARRGDRISS